MKYLVIVVAGVLLLGTQAFLPVHADAGASVVKIEGVDYAFDAPDRIKSGWTTFDYTNAGDEQHFLFLARIPDGQTFDDYLTGIVRPFNDAWIMLREGEIGSEKVDAELGAALPDWFSDVVFFGGSGVIEPGMTTRLTLDLDPGTYAIECYMKTEGGELHSMEGMIRELVVTEESSAASEPEAGIDITLTNKDMTIDGDLTPGEHTVAVHAAEHPKQGFGHNIHIARLDEATDVDEVIRWMNFLELDGLRPPSPARFVGGMHILPEGGTGYFELELEPGRYLFVSEVTSPTSPFELVTVE